jgi:phosphatidate cytidylyltransferase
VSGGSVPALADAPRRWVDLRLRVLSAAVLAPAVLVCVWFGGVPFLVLMLVVTLGLCLEWSRLHRWPDTAPATIVLSMSACGAVLAAGLDHGAIALAILGVGALTLAFALPRDGLATGFLGLPYVGAGAAALTWLRADDLVGREEVFFLLLLVWASDIGAYMAGRLIGGPRLAPAISPNKTWSGAIGGLCTAVGVALAICFMIQAPGSIVASVLMAAGLGIVAQAGDLFESAIKRQVGAKDSGHIIPGHGGLLDRLDALLAAAPVAALLALAAGRGVVLWQ